MSYSECDAISVFSILGEPRDPRTWSRSPTGIIEAIEKLGYPVAGFDSGIRNRYLNIALAKMNQLAGSRQIESRRMRLTRMICAIKVYQKTQSIKSTRVLHMGTLDLPIFKEDKGTKHYLYCDSTWNLLVKHAPRMGRHAIRASLRMDELERRCYSQMEHIFSASEYVRENLIEHYRISPDKVTVVGVGVGKIQSFTGQKDYRSGHILFVVKHAFEGKGGPLLFKGFEIAQKRNPDLRLVVVGGEEYRERLNGLPNVTVTGYISWDELQDLYNRAALFAMPAVYEPWGQVYVEALLCKSPILGLNRNSLPEITDQGKYGILVEHPVPEAVAEGLIQAFQNPDKLEQMGLEGQIHCLNKYTWDIVAKQMTQVMFQ
jgi:glycosyltransferase involved in cell wall biosynthesis